MNYTYNLIVRFNSFFNIVENSVISLKYVYIIKLVQKNNKNNVSV